jgi:hypothetical protein
MHMTHDTLYRHRHTFIHEVHLIVVIIIAFRVDPNEKYTLCLNRERKWKTKSMPDAQRPLRIHPIFAGGVLAGFTRFGFEVTGGDPVANPL